MAKTQPKPDNSITVDRTGTPQRRPKMDRDQSPAPEGNPRHALAEAALRVRAALDAAERDTDRQQPPAWEDAARMLAAGDQVVLPILERSEQLAEADLVEIALSGSETRRQVIARRQGIDARLAEALIAAGEHGVVLALLRNHDAEIERAALNRVIDRFKRDREIGAALVRRPCLPVSVIQRLTALVTDEQRDYLLGHHRLPGDARRALVRHGRERATVGLLAESADGLVVSHNPRAATGAAVRAAHGPGTWAPPPQPRSPALLARPADSRPKAGGAGRPSSVLPLLPFRPTGPADNVDLGDLASRPASTRAAKGKTRKRARKR